MVGVSEGDEDRDFLSLQCSCLNQMVPYVDGPNTADAARGCLRPNLA